VLISILARSSGIGSLRTNNIECTGQPELATDDATKAELKYKEHIVSIVAKARQKATSDA